MERYDYLIIGGGIAGTTAAETIRKADPTATVGIVSDEPYPLYSRILLSKPSFFLGKVPFDSVWMRHPEQYLHQQIDLLIGRRAVKLSLEDKTIVLDNGQELVYGQLLLAIGCAARHLNVPGIENKKGVNYVKTLDDAKQIIENVKKSKQVVVVGSGFIGFEMCDILHQAGLKVFSVFREQYFWEPALDVIAGKFIEKTMQVSGVEIHPMSEIAEILGNETVSGVKLQDGTLIESQMVVIGAGVKLDQEWLQTAGLNIKHGITTDQTLATNLKDVWAAGDVAEINCPGNDSFMCGTWLDAQEQGRTAALNMLGGKNKFNMASPYSAHGFGLNLVFVGRLSGTNSKVYPRGDISKGSYGGIVVQNNERVIGGFLIGRGEELTGLKSLIAAGDSIKNNLNYLTNPEVDLTSLL